MAKYTHFYLIYIQYLGFRFHGWQKQPNVKSIHEMIDKTMSFVLEDQTYKTMGSSRTDARVSAQRSAFELFLYQPIEDLEAFLDLVNQNLPPDYRALEVHQVDANFNVLQSSDEKEYHYYFASGEKAHPYSSPFVYTHAKPLNVELMQEGARLFQGTHHFKAYCTQPKENTSLERHISLSEIVANDGMQANFFPEEVFIYKVRSKGFLRNQVRLMMGHLLQLGAGEISLEDIKHSLATGAREHSIYSNAPASGLHLVDITFK